MIFESLPFSMTDLKIESEPRLSIDSESCLAGLVCQVKVYLLSLVQIFIASFSFKVKDYLVASLSNLPLSRGSRCSSSVKPYACIMVMKSFIPCFLPLMYASLITSLARSGYNLYGPVLRFSQIAYAEVSGSSLRSLLTPP